MSRIVRIPQTASLKPSGSGVETSSGAALQVFVCDDDLNQQLSLVLAAEEASIAIEFTFIDSCDELMILLSHRIEFGGIPDLILLDVDRDGRQALGQLQTHRTLWQIPILMLTNDESGSDTAPHALNNGWCQTRPDSFDCLVELVNTFDTRAAQHGVTIALHDIDLADSELSIDLSTDLSIGIADLDQ